MHKVKACFAACAERGLFRAEIHNDDGPVVRGSWPGSSAGKNTSESGYKPYQGDGRTRDLSQILRIVSRNERARRRSCCLHDENVAA